MKVHEAVHTVAPPTPKPSLTRVPSPLLQRSATNAEPAGQVPSSVHDVLQSPGQPLDTGTRSIMESRFGSDLSGVRIHTGDQAAQSARDVNALAYTVGQDIVFDESRYQPSTPGGQRLLAHELAHTVQQRGLQTYSADMTIDYSAGSRYEREAENAAELVASSRNVPAIIQQPIAPLLSRIPNDQPPAPATPAAAAETPAPPQPLRAWEDLPDNSPLRAHGITARQDSGDIVAFRVNEFHLPPSKGPVLPIWRERAQAQALEATIEFIGNNPPRTGLWQSRDRTNELRRSWLAKVGWTEDNAGQMWHQRGGDAPQAGSRPFRPRVKSLVGQMDHIVELQLGGTNSRENIQVLDAEPNQESGREIWNQVSTLARLARESLLNKPRYILLHFDRVSQTPEVSPFTSTPQPGQANSSLEVDAAATSNRAAPTAAQGLEVYPIVAVGGTRDNLQVLPAPNETDLTGAENRAPSQLISGMLLRVLHRNANTPDSISAEIDRNNLIGNRQATRVPLTVQNAPSDIRFQVDRETRILRMWRPAHPAIEFLYPYLSRGNLTLSYDPETGLSGTGTLRPSLPLLNRLTMNVELGRDRLRAFIAAPPERLNPPFPGFRFTRADLGVDIAPSFRPTGTLGFEVGPRGRPILTGAIEASADASGLVFQGTLNARIPNTDVAQGNVAYRNRQWSGFVVVESSQIRFPGVQRGQVRIDFNPDGSIAAGGQVDLLVADNPVTLSARLARGNLNFRGEGTFRLPGLDPLTAIVETDGSSVNFQGRTGFTIRALSGTMLVRYRNGRWSGEGQAQLNRGRAQGTVTVRLSETGRISGDGSIQYRFTENLIGRVGVLLREDRTIRLSGELRFETIQLFREISDRRRLYRFPRISIPILGIALGPVDIGLVARINAEIGIHYGIGPGVLRNTRIAAAIDLLSDNPNLEFEAGTELAIPIGGGFYLTVEGAIALSAGIASISGGVSVTGDAGLRGAFTANALLQYRASQWRLRAAAELLVHPELILTIDARARAEAGVGPFTVEAVRSWNLARFSWGSDLNFGLRFPFEYVSGQEFRFPSFDQIEWVYPREIDFTRMLRQVIR